MTGHRSGAVQRMRLYPLELISAMAVISWGVMLLNPYYNAFAVGPYREIARHMTEHTLGLIAVCFGLVALTGLLAGSRPARKFGLLLVLAFRLFSFVFVGLSSQFRATGLPDYFFWSVLAVIALVQVDRG